MMVDRYLLLEELGRGGMSVVFRARDLRGNRDVALKLLPPELMANPLRRALLEREARAAAAIVHPNVTAVLECAAHAEVPHLAMELARGENLRRHLERGLEPERALRIALQIARGLAAAHAAGVVHRDLKPENVVVDAYGATKILDFGLATLHEPSAAPLAPHSWGTRQYMAPELLCFGMCDQRADVYAFGVLLHELLSGEAPGACHSVPVTTCGSRSDSGPAQRRARQREASSERAAAATARLERSGAAELVRACLSHSPDARPLSGGVLVEALEALGDGSR